MHTIDYIPILFVGIAFFSLAFKMMLDTYKQGLFDK